MGWWKSITIKKINWLSFSTKEAKIISAGHTNDEITLAAPNNFLSTIFELLQSEEKQSFKRI